MEYAESVSRVIKNSDFCTKVWVGVGTDLEGRVGWSVREGGRGRGVVPDTTRTHRPVLIGRCLRLLARFTR